MSTTIGCLSMLAVWGLSSFFFWSKLNPKLEARIWIAIGLGLLVAFLLGQIWTLLINIKKLVISGRPMESWKDGDLVGISGQIRPKENAVRAPASKREAVIVEYELERKVVNRTSKGTNTSYVKDISGFLMTPCGIHTKRGMLRLHGFPLLNSFSSKIYSEQNELEDMAEYLATTTYEPVSSNPISAFKELAAVLNDEDGDVLKNFVNSHSEIRPDLFETDNNDETEVTSNTEDLVSAKKSSIVGAMVTNRYHISEKVVPVGMEVTAFGTYNEQKRAINVGSALKSTAHSLQPGKLAEVARWGVIKSFLGLVFWSSALVTACYFALPEVKTIIDQQIARL